MTIQATKVSRMVRQLLEQVYNIQRGRGHIWLGPYRLPRIARSKARSQFAAEIIRSLSAGYRICERLL